MERTNIMLHSTYGPRPPWRPPPTGACRRAHGVDPGSLRGSHLRQRRGEQRVSGETGKDELLKRAVLAAAPYSERCLVQELLAVAVLELADLRLVPAELLGELLAGEPASGAAQSRSRSRTPRARVSPGPTDGRRGAVVRAGCERNIRHQ